jgi:hypothetical protein
MLSSFHRSVAPFHGQAFERKADERAVGDGAE